MAVSPSEIQLKSVNQVGLKRLHGVWNEELDHEGNGVRGLKGGTRNGRHGHRRLLALRLAGGLYLHISELSQKLLSTKPTDFAKTKSCF